MKDKQGLAMSLSFLNKSMVSGQYVGRFAPSPSGPLHKGSLVAAVGSFLQAKSQNGSWLLRIDDIDPPREVSGSVDDILSSLTAHGLEWDGEVYLQSGQYERYEAALTWLSEQGHCYFCNCTRKQINQFGGRYQGCCRDKHLSPVGCSLRFRNLGLEQRFTDGVLGEVHSEFVAEDFVIKRKDGLYAYHLAAVLDDICQGVTEIVRGADLLSPTFCQLALYKVFNEPRPSYAHLPVMAEKPGKKISKQNHAPALDNTKARENLLQTMAFLGLPVSQEIYCGSVKQILEWGIANWQLSRVPQKREIIL
jgi:glutamyl-Q tRNA(Asp) synthetase